MILLLPATRRKEDPEKAVNVERREKKNTRVRQKKKVKKLPFTMRLVLDININIH